MALDIGTLLSVGGSLLGGFAEQQAGSSESASALKNAARAEAQGKEALKRGREEGRRQVGKRKALAGASDFMMSGSMLDAINESMREAEYDALAQQEELQSEAANYRDQAAIAKKRGGMGMLSGLMGAGASLFAK